MGCNSINSGKKENEEYDIFTAHKGPSADYRFGEIIDLSGENATIRWNDSAWNQRLFSSLYPADDQIVSGRIDIGRCMFCGLCMEACDFSSFFMTNEYDGMSGFTRQDLWFDAERTRVLPSQHQEAVDAELAKRAAKERAKRKKSSKGKGKSRGLNMSVVENSIFFIFAIIAIGGSLGTVYAKEGCTFYDVSDFCIPSGCRCFYFTGS